MSRIARHDIQMGRGMGFQMPLTVGSAYDLTGKVARLRVRPQAGSSTLTYQLDSTDSAITISGQGVTFDIQETTSGTQTGTDDWATATTGLRYAYSIDLYATGGEPDYRLQGTLEMIEDAGAFGRVSNDFTFEFDDGVTLTVSGGTTSLADESVTNAKLAHVATQTFKGRTSAGTGDVEDLTAAQAMAVLNNSATALDLDSGGTNATTLSTAMSEVLRVNSGGTAIESTGKTAPSGDFAGTSDTQTLSDTTLTKLLTVAATELTIATGDITVTQGYHTVDTESDAASDNLDGIVGGAGGQLLILRPASDARTVVVRHNQNAAASKNILIPGDTDVTLDDEDDCLLLLYDATLDTNGAWMALAQFSAGGGGDFADGGDVAGADRTLGNTDAFDLGLLVNNIAALSLITGAAADSIVLNSNGVGMGAAAGGTAPLEITLTAVGGRTVYVGGGHITLQNNKGIGTTDANEIIYFQAAALEARAGNNVAWRAFSTGDFGVGVGSAAPSAGSGEVAVFGDNAGDPTMAANTAGIYAKDVSGTVEMFAIDESNNPTQLSSHPADAPPQFYLDTDLTPPRIEKTIFPTLGYVCWYRADLNMKLEESFRAYNRRHGLRKGDRGHLQQRSHDEIEAVRVAASERQRARWAEVKAREEGAGRAFDEPEPALYVPRPEPAHMQQYHGRST